MTFIQYFYSVLLENAENFSGDNLKGTAKCKQDGWPLCTKAKGWVQEFMNFLQCDSKAKKATKKSRVLIGVTRLLNSAIRKFFKSRPEFLLVSIIQ